MTHGSLFSGIGGFDLAAEWMGWQNVFHCEWNPFGQKVLKHYWPNAKSYHDITKTDFTVHSGSIDILTGGFPCQPYSAAGKRRGKEDDRHLWPEMLRAIREIRPRWVVGENVRGLINWSGGLVFDEVQSDLENEGYTVFPFLLPACAVNAPHRRDRVWFVAYSGCTGGIQHWRTIFDSDWNSSGKEQGRQHQSDGFTRSSTIGIASDTRSPELQRCDLNGGIGEKGSFKTSSGQLSRPVRTTWEIFPTQSPICTRDDGFSAESLRQRIREDRMGYLSEKEIDKIISKAHAEWTKESIKAAGNAIVPQVALQIFQSIQQYESL